MTTHAIVGALLLLGVPSIASADLLTFTGTGTHTGLGATADVTWMNATTLKIVLTNTSTSLPAFLQGSDANSNQLLTTLAFQLPTGVDIVGGSAAISPGSTGPAGNLSTEWGHGWDGNGYCCEATDPMNNYRDWVSTKRPGTVQFAPGSIGGSNGLSGPDFGLSPTWGESGGTQNAIRNSATFTLALTGPVPDLSFLQRGAVVEFGSDAAFLSVPGSPPIIPEPAIFGLLLLGLASVRHRLSRI